MAYTRRHWVDYPDTSTPIDADALNNIEDGIEESHNIQLLAVTDTAPSECADGDKYYNTTTGLIYTATGTNEWGETGETPIADILYIVLDEQTSYTYNGTTLVSVGGGSSTGGGETLPVGSEIDYDGSTVPTGWEETTPIIESGTDYIKYYDGTMICYGAVSLQANENRSAGGLTYYSGATYIDFSQSFTSTDFSIFTTVGLANMNYFCQSYASPNSVSQIRVSFISTGKDDTRRVSYVAIGKWK